MIDDLLIQVQKREVELFDINLTELARAFQQTDVALYPGAKFIAGLAHLIYLKAVSLVPVEEAPVEEEDFEALRLASLEEYAAFKEVAMTFSKKEKEQANCYWRPTLPVIPDQMPRPLHVPLDLEEFSRLFVQIWEQAKERTLRIYEEEWNLADALKIVREQLKAGRLGIQELFPEEYSKMQLIVTFLAVLELLKNQEARLIKEKDTWYLLCQ